MFTLKIHSYKSFAIFQSTETLIYISVLGRVTYIRRVTYTVNINRKYRGGFSSQPLTGGTPTLILGPRSATDRNGIFYESYFGLIVGYLTSQLILEQEETSNVPAELYH